jgi:hypothetical protein
MKLIIEWRHLDVENETCDRCYDTGENLNHEVKRLNKILQPIGIEVEFIDTKLNDQQIQESNTIYFNEIPIENILDIEVSENYCEPCTSILGRKTYCRTVIFEENEYEDVPAKAIRQAALKVLGLENEHLSPSKKSECCCNSGNNNCC